VSSFLKKSLSNDFQNLKRAHDVRVAECARNAEEKANLEAVLEQFQMAKRSERRDLEEEKERYIADAEAGQRALQEWTNVKHEFEEIKKANRNMVHESKLYKHEIIKLEQEIVTTKHALESTIQKLHKYENMRTKRRRRQLTFLLVLFCFFSRL